MLRTTLIAIFLLGLPSLLAQPYYLAEKPGDASCASFILEDANGKQVAVLDEIKPALECPSVIDLSGQVLITYINNKLIWYNITTQQVTTLVELYSDIDGVSPLMWSSDGSEFMTVIINQEKRHGYKEFCRIIVLSVDESGRITSKQKFDRPVHFSCVSICSSDPETDYRFKDANTIEYRRHELIEDRPGEWETILLK